MDYMHANPDMYSHYAEIERERKREERREDIQMYYHFTQLRRRNHIKTSFSPLRSPVPPQTLSPAGESKGGSWGGAQGRPATKGVHEVLLAKANAHGTRGVGRVEATVQVRGWRSGSGGRRGGGGRPTRSGSESPGGGS